MIVKDEEDVIARALECALAFSDEIIVVDTGSADKTAEIAGRYTDKIYPFEWKNDFSAARNYSFSKASCELVMWLDADDVVEREDCEKIAELKEKMKDHDVAMLLYAAAFEGGRPTYTYFRERIFRREAGFVWRGAVHEAIAPRGKVLYSDAVIKHKKLKPRDKWRNLNIYRDIISGGGALAPRDKFYYGRELMFCGLYTEAAAVLEGYLCGEGTAENKCEACIDLSVVYGALGLSAKSEEWAARSFLYGYPKSRACCMLGEKFLNEGNCEAAMFWYKTAAALPQRLRDGGFCDERYCGYVPFMQLCVINYRLGNLREAERYNALAAEILPDDPGVRHNLNFFGSLYGK